MRPLLNSWRSHAVCAMTYGLRGKAMVTLVAISICSVCSAASVSARIELCFNSPVAMPSKPAASARCTCSLMSPSQTSP